MLVRGMVCILVSQTYLAEEDFNNDKKQMQ
jgi:hypothetical protein